LKNTHCSHWMNNSTRKRCSRNCMQKNLSHSQKEKRTYWRYILIRWIPWPCLFQSTLATVPRWGRNHWLPAITQWKRPCSLRHILQKILWFCCMNQPQLYYGPNTMDQLPSKLSRRHNLSLARRKMEPWHPWLESVLSGT
jgi:hypothetical protein